MSSFIKTESLPETGHVIRKLVKMHRKKQANPYLLNPTLMLRICYGFTSKTNQRYLVFRYLFRNCLAPDFEPMRNFSASGKRSSSGVSSVVIISSCASFKVRAHFSG